MSLKAFSVFNSLTCALGVLVALAGCQGPSVTPVVVQTAFDPSTQTKPTRRVEAGMLTGRVAFFDGSAWRPVSGARVTVARTRFETLTDSAGNYTFRGLPAGHHVLSVSKAGYSQEETVVRLTPASGLDRAHVAVRPVGYALQQAGASVTVSGVVKDPRGAALGGATVRYAATGSSGNGQVSATATANGEGFFTFQLTGLTATEASPAYLQLASYGASPGGVRLESQTALTRTVTGNTVVLHPVCDAWTTPGAITYPEGAFLGGVAPRAEAAIELEGISRRVDEFFVEVEDAAATYAIIANSVTPVPGASAPFRAVVRFRPPATLTGSQFNAYVRPFGGVRAPQWATFVTRYEASEFAADVLATAGRLQDGTETLAGGNYNAGVFVPGETAIWTLDIVNGNGRISQDLRLSGQSPPGTRISSFLLSTRTSEGASVLARVPQSPGANFSVNAGTGNFELNGFSVLPGGSATLEVEFETPVALAPGVPFQLANLRLQRPDSNLTHSTPVTYVDELAPIRGDLDVGTWRVTKVIEDAGGGRGIVRLRIEPVGASAMGAIRLQDTTLTNLDQEPQAAMIEGNALATPAPPPGAPLGFSPGEILVLSVDGATVSITPLPAWTLEDLTSAIEIITAGRVRAERNPSNHLRITHRAIGASSTLEVDSATTDNLATLLGLTEGALSVGESGLFTIFPSVASLPIFTEGAPTRGWRFAEPEGRHVRVGGQGRVNVSFTLVPPADAPDPLLDASDTYDSPVRVTYFIQRDTGASFSLGGGGDALGPRILSVNPVAPYSDAFNDVLVTDLVASDASATDISGVI
ncbi:MAG: carboxypeptidase-like regulatory domain-containing protein [Candidatus Sericytochromatia bacterium]|nr:carboxypeptidase-like regulatory domain-containing protein [Candidatus Sericytochromatia bacterium]